MAEDNRQELYDIQITAVVHGFLQVWNRFEVTLSREMAQIHERLEGMHPDSHPNANYELFYRVSSTLCDRGNLTMSELGNALTVPLSTATRIADWLVDRGYIERLPDAEDRRVVRVALTPAGQEMHKTIDGYVRQRIKQVFSRLTDEERKTLLELVGKVVASLKEATA